MTEAEWLTTELPLYMLKEYPADWNERKACLAGCVCLRRAREVLNDAHTRRYVEAVERLVEGEMSDQDFKQLWISVYHAAQQSVTIHDPAYTRYALVGKLTDQPSRDSLIALFDQVAHPGQKEKNAQCELLRDIFGNPFRPITLDPAWRTSDVLALARGTYAERAFDRLPILADALQDAGCNHDDILNHCRNVNQVHVRGCWVVDRILGKG